MHGSGKLSKSGDLTNAGKQNLQASLDAFEHPLVEFVKSNTKNPGFTALTPSDIREYDEKYKQKDIGEKEAESLMALAFRYKNINAVQLLYKNGVALPDTPNDFAALIEQLFVNTNINDNGESTRKLFDYLMQDSTFQQQLKAMTPNELNDIYLRLAQDKEHAACQLMLKFNLVDNVNYVDQHGHTAQFYFNLNLDNLSVMQSDYDENREFILALNQQLDARGATLNEVDTKAIAQNTLSRSIIDSITEDNNSDNYELRLINANPDLITQDQFEDILDTAVLNNAVRAVELLLENKHAEQINWSKYHIFDAVKNMEIANLFLKFSTEHRVTYIREPAFDYRVKEISHRLGLSDFIETIHDLPSMRNQLRKVMLDGSNAASGVQALAKSTSQYSTSHPEFNRYAQAVDFSANAGTIKDKLISTALYVERQQAGEPIIFGTGWTKHVIGIGVRYNPETDKTYIAVANRGLGGLPGVIPAKLLEKNDNYGTAVLEIDGQLPQEFYKLMAADSEYMDARHFAKTLSPYLASAKMMTVLPAGDQGHETCAYVNQKRVLEGMLWVDKYIAKANLDVAKEYKSFSYSDKKAAFDDLLQLYLAVKNQAAGVISKQEYRLMLELIAQVFIQRGSIGVENDSLMRLYHALDDEARNVIPAKHHPKNIEHGRAQQQFGLFNKPKREIGFRGDRLHVEQHSDVMQALQRYLIDNGAGRDKVKFIKANADSLTIYTIGSRETKAFVRDVVIKEKLGAAITNVDGKYEFVLNDLTALARLLQTQYRPGGGK